MDSKILLVDDIPMFLEIQKDLLKPFPVQIATAADGLEALGLVERFGPDLVVLDMHMPGMDGVACCSALKLHSKHRRIPIIMMVSTLECEAEICRAAGCDAVLQKPLDAGSFLDAVNAFIPGIEARSKRVPLLAPVVVRSGGRTFGGALLNISRSGACLEPDENVAVGAPVELTLQLPSAEKGTVELRGSVVRLRSPDINGMHAGVGICFEDPVQLQKDLDTLIKGE